MATYKYSPKTKELELISDRPAKLRPSVYMPKDTMHTGHFFENLNCHVRNKDHKRQIMKERGIGEAG